MQPFVVSSIQYDTGVSLLAGSFALLDAPGGVHVPQLRWYVPTDRSIVLGRGQHVVHEVPQLTPVLRPSGGGAVLLDPTLLSVDVVLPPDHPFINPASMSQSFIPVGQAFQLALTRLGIANIELFEDASQATRMGSDHQAQIAKVCYASMGRGELSVGGRKIVGLSQRQRRHGTLIQCGILHVWQPDPLIQALDVHDAAPAIYAGAMGIDELTSEPLSDEVLREAVSQAMHEVLVGYVEGSV